MDEKKKFLEKGKKISRTENNKATNQKRTIQPGDFTRESTLCPLVIIIERGCLCVNV
jgi:hypothetical protein